VTLDAVETREYGANGLEGRARLTTTVAMDAAASPDSAYWTHTAPRPTQTVNPCATGRMKATRIAMLDAANRTNNGANGRSGTARPRMIAVMVNRADIVNVSTNLITKTLNARKDAEMERHMSMETAMQDAVNRTNSGQLGVNGSAM